MFSPKFTITNKILKYIGQIEAAKEIIENSPLVPAYEAKFREDALVRSIHYGTHIEGNDLSLTEAKEVLEGKEITARERDIKEVINYRKVIDFINSEGDREKPITKDTLLKIHSFTIDGLIPKDQIGHFRIVPVVLRGVKSGQVTYSPPASSEIQPQVEEFLSWLNLDEDTHPVLKAGISHYELVRIHPFTEGNGRTARAMATLVMFKEDYDVKKFFSLEEYYDKDLPRYYDILQQTSNQLVSDESGRDLTVWLDYFTEGLAVELSRVREKVQKLSVDVKLKGKLGQIPLNDRQLKLVEYMQETGQINNNAWRNLLPMVSDDTILRDLKYLIKKGIIKKRGSTKAAVYVIK